MHILVSTTHCSVQRTLELGQLPSYIEMSHQVKEFTWMRASNCHWSVQNLPLSLWVQGLLVSGGCHQHLTLNYDFFMSWPCILEISELDCYFLCRLLTGYSNLKHFLSNDLPPSVKSSRMDLYYEAYDGRQGLEMWLLHLGVIRMPTDGFEPPL